MGKERPKILISDDAKVNRKMLASIFSDTYQVIEAEDGEETIDLVQRMDDIRLILLDLMMPKKSGFDVLDYLNTSHKKSKIPVIYHNFF